MITPLDKHWEVAARISPDADLALQSYPPVLRQILYNRGYATPEAAHQYLEAQPPAGTDPANLTGMSTALDRIQYAIQHQEPIAIYGDYDADGVTATALLVQALKLLGADVREYIPNRFDEGYGLNNEALSVLHASSIRLVITVDCGIRSLAEADHARQLGLDLIITDHHHPADELPHALATINPKQPGDTYPDKDLAGVGLAYKLADGLLKQGPASAVSTDTFLDLVALGTVADLAPLVGENRTLVRSGLYSIRRPSRQGLMALIGVAGLNPSRITATDLGFALGPRLNAAGRLDSALAAFRLLTTQDIPEAARLAQELDNQNRERQKVTRQIQEQAQQIAQSHGEDALLLFADDPAFNPGVVGLAASRLTELFYRPVIVAHHGEAYTRGSCRSIPEFHITAALDQCADLLEHHGGHAAAAGFTVRNENLPILIERLQAIASAQLAHLDLRPVVYADVEIPLAELKPDLLKYLDWLQPTGYGNRQAAFVSRGLRVTRQQAVGKDSSHLKLAVTDGQITYDAIAFRQGHWVGKMPAFIDLLYTFEMNEYNGRQSLQLNVRDLRPAA
jgi:single-stranded-DNA-specific exonuclease